MTLNALGGVLLGGAVAFVISLLVNLWMLRK